MNVEYVIKNYIVNTIKKEHFVYLAQVILVVLIGELKKIAKYAKKRV